MIEPNLDAYGTDSRPVALADHMELLAMSGRPGRLASLGNMIEDNSWDRKRGQQFTVGDADPEEPDDLVEQTRSALLERADVLDDLYPFEVTAWGVRAKPGFPLTTYHLLLAITCLHAHAVTSTSDPRQAFERVVTNYMSQLGLLSADFGALTRESPDLLSALDRLRPSLELTGASGSPVHRKSAMDAGVDVVSHLWHGDTRPGRWLFVGQATCGKSNTWLTKAGEPKIEAWRLWLGEILPPQAFLAVPHHVEELHLSSLVQDGRVVVLDRLRLARLDRGLLPEESALVETLRGQSIMGFTA